MKRNGKALIALLLVAVMVFSLTGCSKIKDIAGGSSSKGPETVWDALREFQEWEGYECEATIDVKSDEVNGTFKLENGKVVKDGNDTNMQFDLSVAAEVDSADVEIDETFIGTFSFVGGVLYVDISKTEVFDVIEDMAGIEIDDDMIESLFVDQLGMKEKDVASTRVFSLEIGSTSKNAKKAQDALTEAFIKMSEKALGEEYTEKDEKNPEWTVSFDQKSAPDVVTAFLEAFMDDFDNIWDNAIVLVEESQNLAIMDKLKDVLGDSFDTSAIDDFLDDSDSYAEDVAEQVEELLDDPEPIEQSFEDMKFTAETVIGYTGKSGAHEMTMESTVNVKSPEKMTVTMNATYKEADVKIEVPEDVTDLNKAIDAAAEMLGGLVGPIGPVGPVVWPTDEPETDEPETEEPMTFAPSSEEPTETEAPATPAQTDAPQGGDIVTGPVNGTDMVLVGEDGIGRIYLEDIGNGFTVDQVYYSDNHGFIDLHDTGDNFAYIYMYEIPVGNYYDKDAYYQSEIMEDIVNNTSYTNTSATEMSFLYSWAANDYNTNYDVYYCTVRYTGEDGDMVKICSFSNLGYESYDDNATIAVSVEIELLADQYDALMSEMGSEYDILNQLYPMIRIEVNE